MCWTFRGGVHSWPNSKDFWAFPKQYAVVFIINVITVIIIIIIMADTCALHVYTSQSNSLKLCLELTLYIHCPSTMQLYNVTYVVKLAFILNRASARYSAPSSSNLLNPRSSTCKFVFFVSNLPRTLAPSLVMRLLVNKRSIYQWWKSQWT